MATKISHKRVELVPIEQIRVLNPRSRNRKRHKEIIENISRVGLKRPIAVSRRSAPGEPPSYDLICGQGRVEAFQALQQAEIPAFVTDATPQECMVLSLVENGVRRAPRPMELVRQIQSLRSRGFGDVRIAKMIGVTSAYVSMLGKLLDSKEDRLLSAVEAGSINIDTAIQIARGSQTEVQRLLHNASQQGFKGRELAVLRRLIEARIKSNNRSPASRTPAKELTPAEVRRMYKREMNRQCEMAKKAESVRHRIKFAADTMRSLLRNREFTALLQSEASVSMPEILKRLVARSEATS